MPPTTNRDWPVLESGLELLEEDLRIDDRLRIDFLARDPTGALVVILCVESEEEELVPLELLDIEIWIRKNVFPLRKALSRNRSPGAQIHWDFEPRFFVVTTNASPSLFDRLKGLSRLNLSVFELSSLRLRGTRHWFTRGVPPWSSETHGRSLPAAPEGLANPEARDLFEQLIARLGGLSPELEISGDRFHRAVFMDGGCCLRIEVNPNEVHAVIGDQRVPVASASDVNAVLDRVLRAQLGMEDSGWLDDLSVRQPDSAARGPTSGRPGSRVSTPAAELPDPRSDSSKRSPDASTRLTDDEMAAFLKP